MRGDYEIVCVPWKLIAGNGFKIQNKTLPHTLILYWKRRYTRNSYDDGTIITTKFSNAFNF